jgi:hypothetical protein
MQKIKHVGAGRLTYGSSIGSIEQGQQQHCTAAEAEALCILTLHFSLPATLACVVCMQKIKIARKQTGGAVNMYDKKRQQQPARKSAAASPSVRRTLMTRVANTTGKHKPPVPRGTVALR